MCSLLAYPLIGVLAAALLMVGVGVAFQGLGMFSLGLAVLGQTIMQPVFLFAGALLGGLAGFSTALAMPRYIDLYRAISDVRAGNRKTLPGAETLSIGRGDTPQALPAAQSIIVRRPARRRVRVDMDLLK